MNKSCIERKGTMRQKTKQIFSKLLVVLMVFTCLQSTPLTAYAATVTELTYNFIDLEKVNSYGVDLTVSDGGELTADFNAQYQESFYKLPDGIDATKVKNVELILTDGEGVCIKLYPNADGTDSEENKHETAYSTSMAPTKEFASFGIMNSTEGANSVKIRGVKFTVKGFAEINKTYTFNDLNKDKGADINAEVDSETGAVTYSYTGQYQEIFYAIPKEIDMSKVHKVTFNVSSDNAADLAFKFYTQENYGGDWPSAPESQVSYGDAEVALADGFDGMKYFGIMSMVNTAYTATVDSVTFHTTGWGYSDGETGEITYGDNIVVNPYFEGEDLSMWTSAAGDSTISSVEGAVEGTDITTYGKIARDPDTSSTQDCFSQDLTDVIEKGEEYTFEFYAMLSDDYVGAPEEQRKVEFCPYFLDGEGQYTYLGDYSNEITGTSSQALEPGVWTKYSGTFKITCSGDDKVVIRIIEQGTNYGQGDCVLGDYYITGVSLNKINKPKPQIEKDIPNWKDSITSGLGDDTIAGTCFGVGSISDEALMELSTKHFNAVSFENELKPDSLLTSTPKLNGDEFTVGDTTIEVPTLTYTNPNKMLDFVKQWNEENDGNFKVRGHVLVWHSQTPEWFFHEDYDASKPYVSKEIMNIRLEWYIKTVLEYYTAESSPYAGMFHGWDVVKEAISDETGKPRRANENSSWAAVYGDQSNEYIINAFRYANKYAPADLELYYNDYNDSVPSKCAGITQLLKDIKGAEGTRIDAMGMQAHHGMDSPTISQIEAAVRSYAGVVGAVQLTELDLKASNSYDGTDATKADEYTKQAYRYKDIFDVLKELDAEDGIEVTGITMWGTIDKLSWLQSSNSVGGASQGGAQCPLLFDDNYHAKPAFWAFVNPDKLEPAIQKVVVTRYMDDTFAQGKEYSFAQGNVTFIPMWDDAGLKILVNVKDATKDDTDAVTVYVDPAITKGDVTPIEVTVNRKDATEVDGGYKMVVSVPLDKVGINEKIAYDMVMVDGDTQAVFNDLTNSQDTSSKYYAEATMKPYTTFAKTPVAITVDGKADKVWDEVEAIPLSVRLGAKADASVKVLWDEENLYVYANVVDSILDDTASAVHEKDSLEIFIDENNAKTDSYEGDDKQYRINYKNEISINPSTGFEDYINSAVTTTTDGYVVEAAFKWSDIAPKIGMEIGFEAQINDAENGGRIGTLSWYDDSGMGWSSTGVYGTAMLDDAVEYEEPEKDPEDDPEKDPEKEPEKEPEKDPESGSSGEAEATPAVVTSYRTHVQSIGWQPYVKDGAMSGTSGKAKRLEAINLDVEGNDKLGIQYTTHVQSYGWLPWSANGEMNGTEGEAKRLEAIMIQLTGADKDKYDVYYRSHAQSYGWLGWAKNGEPSGTAGYAKRLEGIQVVVLPKGAKAPGVTYAGVAGSATNKAYYAKDNTVPKVDGQNTVNAKYRTHVQTYGWQGFVYNGKVSGTSGQSKRLEGIEIALTNLDCDGGIRYKTHIQTYGWEKEWKQDGKMSGTSGQAKRLEAIQIELYGEAAEKYDVYYRVHAQTYGWLGWAKNGEESGTAGYAKRLEAIQIVLVPKGSAAPANNYDGITSTQTKAFISK